MRLRRTLGESLPLLACALLMGAVVWEAGVAPLLASLASHLRLAAKVGLGIVVYVVAVRCFAGETYLDLLARVRG
jgi:hypothetical protein